jgi:hypothetical protein
VSGSRGTPGRLRPLTRAQRDAGAAKRAVRAGAREARLAAAEAELADRAAAPRGRRGGGARVTNFDGLTSRWTGDEWRWSLTAPVTRPTVAVIEPPEAEDEAPKRQGCSVPFGFARALDAPPRRRRKGTGGGRRTR